MGYTTEFFGEFEFYKPLSISQIAYLQKFSDIRHMLRNESIVIKYPDPERLAVNLPLGKDCQYFVGGKGFAGQDRDSSIIDYNNPPSDQPGLWCKWEPTDDGKFIRWNGVEKFYNYEKWLKYIVDNFLIPWNHNISGVVSFQGEHESDSGIIIANSSDITLKYNVTSKEIDTIRYMLKNKLSSYM